MIVIKISFLSYLKTTADFNKKQNDFFTTLMKTPEKAPPTMMEDIGKMNAIYDAKINDLFRDSRAKKIDMLLFEIFK